MLTVTEATLELFRKDLWKDARYLDVIETEGDSVIRRYRDNNVTIPEEVDFIRRLKPSVRFQIPEITGVTDDFIAFEYIRGTRAFNLFMDLRTLYLHENNAIYRDIALTLLALLKHDLEDFQQAMRSQPNFSKGCQPYPVSEKMDALYRVLTAVIPQVCRIEDIADDLEQIASIYGRAAMIPFRDATPKNMILAIPELFQKRFSSYQQRLDDLKKKCRSGWLQRVLEPEYIYQIDFSGCRHLCTPKDDWVALREHEATVWLADAPAPSAEEQDDIDLSTRFVRFSRFAGRKLAYRLLNHTGYSVRFMHDNEAGYFNTLSDICSRLQTSGAINGDALLELMPVLRSWSGFQPDRDYFEERRHTKKQRTYYSDIFPG